MHQSANPPSNRFTVRAVAQVGNALALFAIVLILVNSSLLFTTNIPSAPAASTTTRAQRVLLVVIDGLRADAVTPEQMPQLYRMGQAGTSRISQSHALIPSTIAGIRALTEGVAVAPAEFVHDFRSHSAPSGGLLETVNRTGGRIFAAGPYLWNDLYGRWIDGHLSVFGLARDDPTILRSARAAAADSQWQLVIAHFSRPDVMAHLHGAMSKEYEESLAWCDRAVGELVRAAGRDTLIVITSDHGVTRAGGHAGAEPDVLNTPLIANDPGFAAGESIPLAQTRIPHLIAAALGAQLPARDSDNSPLGTVPRTLLVLGAIILGGFALRGLVGSGMFLPPPPEAAFWLNLSVWVSLLLAWFTPWVACAIALVILVALGWRFHARLHDGIFAAIVTGLVLGIVRIAGPWFTAGEGIPKLPGVFIIGSVCLASFGIGYIAGQMIGYYSRRNLLWLGAGLVAAAPAFSGFLGESVSLSTLDVRLAFRLIDSPAGLIGAVILGALRPFLPILFLLAGIICSWRRSGESDASLAPLAAGAGALIAGELALAAITLAAAGSHTLAALALGLLLRECALIAVLFPALAGAALLLRGKHVLCDNPKSNRGRAFHPA